MTYNVVRYYFSQKNELWFFGDNRASVHFRRIVGDNHPSLYFRRISATPQRGEWSPRQNRDTSYTDMRPYMVSNIYHYIIYYIWDHNGLNNIHPTNSGTPYMVSNRVAHDVATIWSQTRSALLPTRDHIWRQIYHIISTIMYETIMVLITYTPHPVCYHIWSYYGVANRWSQNRSHIITLSQDICGAD